MAFPFEVDRVTISGDCFGGAEVWSTGFFIADPAAHADDPTSGLAASIASRWQTFFTTTASSDFGNLYRTLQVKLQRLDVNGAAVPDEVAYYLYSPIISGGGGATELPPQISLVATLESVGNRGLASKGRMYLPGIQSSVAGDGRISSTDRAAIATNFAAFINGVNTDIAGNSSVALCSPGRALPPAAGVIRPVTGIRIGNVYDTQRRRRNAIPETYSTATITP